MSDNQDAMNVLKSLEGGEIDINQALSMLEGGDEQEQPSEVEEPSRRGNWRLWWSIVLGIGTAMTAGAAGLAVLGGWWWLCAGPMLILGILLLVMAAVTYGSHWASVRIDTGEQSWPRDILLSVPVPIGLAAWILKNFNHFIPGLDRTEVDDLLVGLGELEATISKSEMITIEVDGEDGEHVEVYLGKNL
jgi:hypothetical protein